MTKPLIRSINPRVNPVNRSNIVVNTKTNNYESLKTDVYIINALENYERAKQNPTIAPISEVSALELDNRYQDGTRLRIQRATKENPDWLTYYADTLEHSDVDAPLVSIASQKNAIKLPDWNAISARLLHTQDNSSSLGLDFGLSHSYTTQLTREGLVKTIIPVSVYAFLRTTDNNAVVGIRGGQFLSGRPMTPAAGSLYVIERDGKVVVDPYEAMQKELKDELGLMPNQYMINGVIGTFYENSLYVTYGLVFDVWCKFDFDELVRYWNGTITRDKREHKELFSVGISRLGNYIEDNAEGIAVIETKNSLARAGAATLLLGLAQLDRGEFDNTIGRLRGVYIR